MLERRQGASAGKHAVRLTTEARGCDESREIEPGAVERARKAMLGVSAIGQARAPGDDSPPADAARAATRRHERCCAQHEQWCVGVPSVFEAVAAAEL
jgi:hypothetical protein